MCEGFQIFHFRSLALKSAVVFFFLLTQYFSQVCFNGSNQDLAPALLHFYAVTNYINSLMAFGVSEIKCLHTVTPPPIHKHTYCTDSMVFTAPTIHIALTAAANVT